MRITKSLILDYLIRFFLGALVYIIFRYLSLPENEGVFEFDKGSLFYFIYTLFLIFLIWEINDRSYSYFDKKYGKELFSKKNIFKYAGFIVLLTVIILLISSYFLKIHLSRILDCEWPQEPYEEMWATYTRSLIVGFLFNLVYSILVFVQYKGKADLIEEKIQKENLLFQYESLRNQIDPHFLFNSFSVLNSLIQKDQKLATEFLSKLSDIYRYLLENKEKNISSLKEELNFLDSYLFLMKIRHDGCINAEIEIDKKELSRFIPTISLQMLVENAIKHNSFSEKNPLKLFIFIEEDYLIVKNELNIRKSSKIFAGIGQQNIQKRYKLHTTKEVIINKNDKCFMVKLPLLK